MEKEKIISDITAKVGQSQFNYWRIGITNDPDAHKKYLTRTGNEDTVCWTHWEADSLTDAQEIEKFFITGKGIKEMKNGELSPGKKIYVYLF